VVILEIFLKVHLLGYKSVYKCFTFLEIVNFVVCSLRLGRLGGWIKEDIKMRSKLVSLFAFLFFLFHVGCIKVEPQKSQMPQRVSKKSVSPVFVRRSAKAKVANVFVARVLRLMNAGKYDEALKVINRALKKNELSILYYKRAEVYILKDKPERALVDLKKALKMKNNLVDLYRIYTDLGAAYYQMDELDKAEDMLNKAEEIAQKMPPARFEQIKASATFYGISGFVNYDRGNTKESAKYFAKSLEKDPTQYHLYLELARALFDIGKKEEARKYTKKWLDYVNGKLDRLPCNEPEKESFAYAYLILGDYEKAFNYINLAIKENPNNLSYYMDRGYFYWKMGDEEKAIADIKLVMKKGSEIDKSNAERLLKRMKEGKSIAPPYRNR